MAGPPKLLEFYHPSLFYDYLHTTHFISADLPFFFPPALQYLYQSPRFNLPGSLQAHGTWCDSEKLTSFGKGIISSQRTAREELETDLPSHILLYFISTFSLHSYLLIPCPHQQIQSSATLEPEASPAELLTTWLLDRLSLPVPLQLAFFIRLLSRCYIKYSRQRFISPLPLLQ